MCIRDRFYATGFIGYFYILTFLIGFGAIVLLMPADSGYMITNAKGVLELKGGQNLSLIHI